MNIALLYVSWSGSFKIPSALSFCSVDREGSGITDLTALRYKISIFCVLRYTVTHSQCEVLCQRCR